MTLADRKVLVMALVLAIGFFAGKRYEVANTKDVQVAFSAYKLKAEEEKNQLQQKAIDNYVEGLAALEEQEKKSAERIAEIQRKADDLVARRAADRVRFESLLAASSKNTSASCPGLDMDAVARGAVCGLAQPAVASRAAECDKITNALRDCRRYVEQLPRVIQ